MTGLPRRTIEELQMRYDHEPSLRDIYVEGFFDIDLVRWFLDCIQARDVEVYPIETVDIPNDMPDGINPEGGNRTRVIRLANALDHSVPKGRIICIIDSDFDRIAEALEQNWPTWQLQHLLQTDVTAMEMYLFSLTSVAKLIHLFARSHNVDISKLLADIGTVLRQVFAVRYASFVGGFRFQWIDFTGCCTHRGEYVRFDQDEFIHRLLNRNASQARSVEFRSKVAAVSNKMSDDPRYASNGHDFVELLRRVLRVHGIFTMPDVDIFERIFVACIELSEVRNYELWRELESILGDANVRG